MWSSQYIKIFLESAETFSMINYEIMVKMNVIKRQFLRHMMFFLPTVQQRKMSRIFLNLFGGYIHTQFSKILMWDCAIWPLWILSNATIGAKQFYSHVMLYLSLFKKRRFPSVILNFALMFKHLRILRFPLFCNLFSKIWFKL
jgi:hypothetical protein